MSDEQSLSPEVLAAKYLARVDWRRSRAPGPPPSSRTLSIWEEWIENDPERAWPLFETLVRLRPEDDEILEQVWYRLRQLLTRHGKAFEARIKSLVAGSARLRRIAPKGELSAGAHRPTRLDVPKLVAAYIINAVGAPDAHELMAIVRADPVVGSRLALEVISRGPDFGFTSLDTLSPLHELLRLHASAVVDIVEAAAAESVLVRRCLWRIGGQQSHPPDDSNILDDVWARLEHATAGTTEYNTEDPPATHHPVAPELEQIIAGWFEYEKTFWAWERVSELVTMDPELAWRVLVLLTEQAPSDSVLGRVGAGPMEDFLRAYGERMIDRVEERARSDARFRQCLAAVWQCEMSDSLWIRVRGAAQGESE